METITSSAINARARQITGRDSDPTDATINTYIYEAANEIAERLYCLKSSSSGTLASSTYTITKPADMFDSQMAIDEIYLDEVLLDPLSFEEWRSGKFDGYAYRDGTIYINPLPNSDKSYTLYYRKEHSTTITTLELNYNLKKAVIYKVCQLIYEGFELYDEARFYEEKYESELEKNTPAEPIIGQMRKDTRD